MFHHFTQKLEQILIFSKISGKKNKKCLNNDGEIAEK